MFEYSLFEIFLSDNLKKKEKINWKVDKLPNSRTDLLGLNIDVRLLFSS